MSSDPRPPDSRRSALLERTTAWVLVAVMAALGWIVVAAYRPALGQIVGLEIQVALVLALLTAALVLVSAVALRHTRA